MKKVLISSLSLVFPCLILLGCTKWASEPTIKDPSPADAPEGVGLIIDFDGSLSPMGFPQVFSTIGSSPVEITLTGQAAKGKTSSDLVFSIKTKPTKGHLTGEPPNVVYQADPDFEGTDSFVFKIQDTEGYKSEETVSVTVKPAVVQLSLGESHSCSLSQGGWVKCWGKNAFGQLGRGDTKETAFSEDLPRVDLGQNFLVKTVVSGQNHSCALSKNGLVKCWGLNDNGQLGTGDLRNRGASSQDMGEALPILALGESATSLALGNAHSCALLKNSIVKCWGHNGFGQLGQGGGATGNSPVPFPIPAGKSVLQISAGAYHTCVVLNDKSAFCLGSQQHGQLGGPTNPLSLGSVRTVEKLASAGGHNCALLDGNEVKCWGANYQGQLGLGDKSNRGLSPDQMGDALSIVGLGSEDRAKDIAVGPSHSCAFLSSGKVKCWGEGFQASPGDSVDFGNKKVVRIVLGNTLTCATLEDGTFKCLP